MEIEIKQEFSPDVVRAEAAEFYQSIKGPVGEKRLKYLEEDLPTRLRSRFIDAIDAELKRMDRKSPDVTIEIDISDVPGQSKRKIPERMLKEFNETAYKYNYYLTDFDAGLTIAKITIGKRQPKYEVKLPSDKYTPDLVRKAVRTQFKKAEIVRDADFLVKYAEEIDGIRRVFAWELEDLKVYRKRMMERQGETMARDMNSISGFEYDLITLYNRHGIGKNCFDGGMDGDFRRCVDIVLKEFNKIGVTHEYCPLYTIEPNIVRVGIKGKGEKPCPDDSDDE